MEIIKFNNTFPFSNGEIINGLTSKMWIERFNRAGEFTISAPVSTGMKTKLPVGSYISHTNSTELMKVENHEISQTKGEEPDIVISGRSFISLLENRSILDSFPWPYQYQSNPGLRVPPETYILGQTYLGNQIVQLIKDSIDLSTINSHSGDVGNAIPYITTTTPVGLGWNVIRYIQSGKTVLEVLYDLLDKGQIGIKAIRPGPWSPLGAGSQNVNIAVYSGLYKPNATFAWDQGEIEQADYLWSDKTAYNAVMVFGNIVCARLTTGPTGAARKYLFIDGKDLDNGYSWNNYPDTVTFSSIYNNMIQRATEVLNGQRALGLSKAQASKQPNDAVYRVDYNLGDLLTVRGDYDKAIMRVIEYVEIEDKTGESSYPTFVAL